MTPTTWYVVLARGGSPPSPGRAGKTGYRVMGVYGSALRTKADENAATIRVQFPFQAVDVVRLSLAERPRVGQMIYFAELELERELGVLR